MVLVAAAPSALAYDVVKGPQGPRASAVTWEYTPTGLSIWYGHIVNAGLRSLAVDVYDNTGGMMQEVIHQRIRFAAYGAYPNGVVNTNSVAMSPARTYVITVTPNGPTGSSCTVDGVYTMPSPPVARFSITSDRFSFTVVVDASASSDDDGYITDYQWDWGDGTPSDTGVTASHQYGSSGGRWITLVVTDNDGLTDSEDEYIWFGIPVEPMLTVYGCLYADDGSIVTGGEVTVTNLMSGEVLTTASDAEYGTYWVDFIYGPLVETGDVIEVTAVKGNLSGTNSGVVEYVRFAYMQIDVYLTTVT